MSGLHTISNGRLTLNVSSHGAEMQSLKLDGKEFLWQGNPRYWRDRAINPFPYIARLTGGAYTYQGQPYRMDIHGFVKDSELALQTSHNTTLAFELLSSQKTLEQYPFPFRYRVTYQLTEQQVSIQYQVENCGSDTIYFGIGGHPGFCVPMDEGLDFSDYHLAFSRPCHPNRIRFSPQNFVMGREPFPLEDNCRIPLRHSLFDTDAVVLEGTPGRVKLGSKKGASSIEVDYGGFPYIGFWHTPCTEAPFVCVEPWSSLPSRQGIVEELTRQQDLIPLKAGEVYVNVWIIRPDRQKI